MKLFDTNRSSGSALVTLIIVLPFLMLITALYMELTISSLKLAGRDQLRTHAQLATDAGIDAAMQEINVDNNWVGTAGQIEMHNDGQVRTTYEVSVTAINDDSKVVTSIGRSYKPVSSSTPASTVTVNVDLRAVRSGQYSVVSGVGGLIMSNSARILGGDVFINGRVTLSNSAQIGLSTNPVTLNVAHQSCPNPPNATYPSVCNSGQNGQPINITNSARIYGTVRANNQTNGASMSNPGLQSPNCLVSGGIPSGINCVNPEPLPPHDRAAQIAAVPAGSTNNITGSSASCSSGTRSWPANLKITGNVSIRNGCRVTVSGDAWITGSLTMSNSSEMIVDNSLGTTRPNIMIDGSSASFSNSSILRSNSSSTGFQIITYKSDDTCTTQVPGCATLTGSSLFNSQDDTTIELDNSASGPNTIFYSKWTKVLVKNSGQIGALVGQTVELSNSGTITFGTSTGTGTVFWILDGYRRQFN